MYICTCILSLKRFRVIFRSPLSNWGNIMQWFYINCIWRVLCALINSFVYKNNNLSIKINFLHLVLQWIIFSLRLTQNIMQNAINMTMDCILLPWKLIHIHWQFLNPLIYRESACRLITCHFWGVGESQNCRRQRCII